MLRLNAYGQTTPPGLPLSRRAAPKIDPAAPVSTL
jgi:hypothetical protein